MEIIILSAVADFIRIIPSPISEHVQNLLDALELHGSQMREPHSKALGGGLFELRVVGKIHIRFFYFFYKNRVIVIHAIYKKRKKVSPKDISFARNIKDRVIAAI